MPAAIVVVLVLVAVVIALRGAPTAVAAVLVSTWLLVPGSARVPGTGLGQVFIHRVVILAVVVGLLWRFAAGRVDRHAFAPRGVHVAFGAYVAIAGLVGVVLAGMRTLPSQNFNAWLDLVEQAAFFASALAVFRLCGARRAVQVISSVAGVLALIAISERVFGWSYGRWFATDIVDPTGLLSLPLERRGPHVRVRGAATFALELGWIAALLLPVTLASALTHRHGHARTRLSRALMLVPLLVLVTIILSWSRSAYAGVAIGAVAVLLGVVLDRPRQAAIVALGAVAVVAVVVQAPLQETIDISTTTGEQDVRFERLPDVLEPVADRPLIGLGLGGLLARGVQVVDNSWVNTYATLGVTGILALAALLLASVHATSRFLRTGPGASRVIGAAAAGAVASALVAFASYDFGTLRASSETLWALCALGLVANEETGVLRTPVDLRPPPARVWPMAAVGSLVGLVISLTAPERSTIDAVFTTVDPRFAAAAPTGQDFTVKVLSQTACLAVEDIDAPGSIQCRDRDQLAGGIGEVRIEADTDAEASATLDALDARLRSTFRAATLQVRDRGRGRPTVAVTAPLWAAVLAGAAGALAPIRPGGADGSGPPGPAPATPAPDRRRSRTPTPSG